MTHGESLSARPLQGASYKLRVVAEDDLLLEKNFKTTQFAVERGPIREESLDGVIRQCEGFIAAGRPADAWMLWHQLKASEKQDLRMQELKKLILSKIG